MARNKPKMPAKLRAQAATAIKRHQSRPITPEVAVTVDDGGWSLTSPYSNLDDLSWAALLFEAFGTRQRAVADVFINHLARLCSTAWDGTVWRPDEGELQAAIAIVRSVAPKNESQAALAAQAVAIHFTTMKVATNLAGRSAPDARTVAALASLGKAFSQQLETMQKLQGKRTSRQRITVKNERHIHNHQHVHVTGGGEEIGGQPHEANECRASRDGPRSEVRSQDAPRHLLSLCRDAGSLSLPQARGSKGIRRTGG